MIEPLKHEWHNVTRGDCYTIIPLGDIHLGNVEVDEALYRRVVKRIADDPSCYWIGMGDYIEAIKRSDPRFDPQSLAPWIGIADLGDLAAAQKNRYLELTAPIASQCLGMIEGNHERTVRKWYEQDIYLEMVQGIKEAGGFPKDARLAFGGFGWLRLFWYRAPDGEKQRESFLSLYVHHGFTGGKLAGGKALDMQRWLWTHSADVVLFGHGHGTGVQPEAVEVLGAKGMPKTVKRFGVHCGSFMTQGAYAVAKGYLPLATGYCEIRIRPHAADVSERLRVVAGF